MSAASLWAPENLEQALNSAGLNRRLDRVYSRIPQTVCRRRAKCCRDSPPVFFIEYANMYRCIREVLRPRYQDLAHRCLEYFFFSPADPTLCCPFLDERQCLVYNSRPRVCRAYGLYPQGEDLVEAFRHLRERVAARREFLAQAYGAYGIETAPREPLPFCPYVRSAHGGTVSFSRETRAATKEQLLQLEARATGGGACAERQTFLPFTTHFAYSLFGPTEARSLQIALLRAYQQDPVGARTQVYSLLSPQSSAESTCKQRS